MKIKWNDERLFYSGRMEKDPDRDGVRWVFAASSVLVRFSASCLYVDIYAAREYWDIYLGIIVDGVQTRMRLYEGDNHVCLAQGLDQMKTHEVLLFKENGYSQQPYCKGI